MLFVTISGIEKMDKESKFPKINPSAFTGESGVNIVKSIVESELGWLFRSNHVEHDFGIDAYLDVITDKGQVTGKSIAVQIKSGQSYFSESNEIGYIFRDNIAHLNYYSNLDVLIVILIVDTIKKQVFWEVFNRNKTDRVGKNWKMTIPKNHLLTKSSKTEFIKFVGPITDYASQLESYWQFNQLLTKADNRILFTVPKKDVIDNRYSYLLSGLERLQVTSDLILKLRNRVDVSFDDYEDDSRELFEIPEVKNWILNIFPLTNCWPYLMAMDEGSGFLKLLFFCHVPIEKVLIGSTRKYRVEYEAEDAIPFIEMIFHQLNIYCDENNLSHDTNVELSDKLVKFLFNA